MYCKNCGKTLAENEKYCAQCGTPKIEDSFESSSFKVCGICGSPLNPNDAFCPNCGSASKHVQFKTEPTIDYSPKNRLIGGLLGLFFGTIGVHNFYLGQVKKGVAKIILTIVSIAFIIGSTSLFISSGYTDINTGEFIITDESGITNAIVLFVLGILISSGLSIWALVESILIFVSTNIKDGNDKPLKKI
ncbi:MAG: TM2 domain-containing protein [Acholeplasmataceae bacterium]|nr:TM2 domain-containing protein [Acholeplasmataceae bacterium]